MKVYRQPNGSRIKKVDDGNDIKRAALEKLGWEEITAQDITDDPALAVTFHTVTNAKPAVEPEALPHLVQPTVTEELKTPDKVGDPVLVVTEHTDETQNKGRK